MNNNSINLFRNRKKLLSSHTKVLRMFRIASVGALVILFLFTVVLYVLYSQSSLPVLKNQEEVLTKELAVNKEKINKITLTKNRIKAIDEIIKNRRTFDELINFIVALLPNSIVVESFLIDRKTIVMTMSSSSLGALDQVIKELLEHTGPKKRFAKIFMDDLTLDVGSQKYVLAIKIDM